MVKAMEDVKRKLEHVSSFFGSRNNGPAGLAGLMKRVKSSDFFDKDHIKRNTRDNVQMVKNKDAMEAEYVKPLRKINSSKSICDDAASSCSECESTGNCKSVKFTQFVEEICYVGCTPEPTKEEEEKRCMILEVLGLDKEAKPPTCTDGCVDQVVEAVAAARLNCPEPSINLIPLNDNASACKFVREQFHPQDAAAALLSPCSSTEEMPGELFPLTVELPTHSQEGEHLLPEHSVSGPGTPVDILTRKCSHPDELDFQVALTLNEDEQPPVKAPEAPGSGVLSSCSTAIAASLPPPMSLSTQTAKV